MVVVMAAISAPEVPAFSIGFHLLSFVLGLEEFEQAKLLPSVADEEKSCDNRSHSREIIIITDYIILYWQNNIISF